jgi:nitrate/nitrite transport system substrate-binding protein
LSSDSEKGFLQEVRLDVTIAKGANWAAIRDSLSSGDNQMTHMLIGMPIASTMGLLGSPKKPMIIPWLVNRNGQAITLKADWKGKVGADPKALKPFVDQAKKLGEPLSFAMTFPPGTHAMWMRYYLAAGGINPDKDVALITVPPPQMVANMKIGKMDGFCVGEPWNARSHRGQDRFHLRHHAGHVEGSSGKSLRVHGGVCRQESQDGQRPCSRACTNQRLARRPEQSSRAMRHRQQAELHQLPEGNHSRPLQGKLDYGDGRTIQDEFYMHFSKRNCNYPQPAYAKWWLTQFRRWGMVSRRAGLRRRRQARSCAATSTPKR